MLPMSVLGYAATANPFVLVRMGLIIPIHVRWWWCGHTVVWSQLVHVLLSCVCGELLVALEEKGNLTWRSNIRAL